MEKKRKESKGQEERKKQRGRQRDGNRAKIRIGVGCIAILSIGRLNS